MTNYSVAEPTGTQDGSPILGEGAVIDHEALKDGSATLTSPEAMLKLSEEPTEESKQKIQALIAETGKPKDDPSIIPEPKPEPEPSHKEPSESKEGSRDAPSKSESISKREKVDGEEKVHDLLGNSEEPPPDDAQAHAGEGEDVTGELKAANASGMKMPQKKDQEPLSKTDIMEGYSGEVGPRGMPVEIKKQLLDEEELTPPSQSNTEVGNANGTTSASKSESTSPEATTEEKASDKGVEKTETGTSAKSLLTNPKNVVNEKVHQHHAHRPSLLGKLKALKGKLTGGQDKKGSE